MSLLAEMDDARLEVLGDSPDIAVARAPRSDMITTLLERIDPMGEMPQQDLPQDDIPINPYGLLLDSDAISAQIAAECAVRGRQPAGYVDDYRYKSPHPFRDADYGGFRPIVRCTRPLPDLFNQAAMRAAERLCYDI